MDFQSAMETFAEAWVAANTKGGSLSEVGCSQVSHVLRTVKNKQQQCLDARLYVGI
jgi:hypothetical protein